MENIFKKRRRRRERERVKKKKVNWMKEKHGNNFLSKIFLMYSQLLNDVWERASKSVVSSWGLYVGLVVDSLRVVCGCVNTASRSTFPSHTGSPASSIHSISAVAPSTEMQMSRAHLGPPSQGCLSYSAPDKTLPTCPRAWEWGSTGVHIISPTCARPH